MLKKILLVSAIVISTVELGFSQIKIKGTVTSEKGDEKLAGVKIKIKDTEKQTVTDNLGNFEIEVPNYDAELEIIKDGFEKQIVDFETNEFNIKLGKETFYLNYLNYLDYTNYSNYSNYSNYLNYSDYSNYSNYYANYSNSYLDDTYSNYYNTGYYYSYSDTYYNYYSDYYSNYYNYYYSDSYSDTYTKTDAESSKVASGLLTAGEIHDFSKWDMWNDITEDDFIIYEQEWTMSPLNRYCVQIESENGIPVINAKVILFDQNNDTIWTSISDNTGKAELWGNLFKEVTDSTLKYRIKVEYQNKEYNLKYPKKFKDGINFFKVDAECTIPNIVDIAFVVDATGSMGDEINYLKEELLDLITKIEIQHKDLNIKTASVFYRDNEDDYVTRKSDFTNDINETLDFIKKQEAGGGGDFEEAVEIGLNEAVENLIWDENSISKIIFLILDAPPHQYAESITNMQKVIETAAKKGIRIVPVTCSGIDKSTEFLMRTAALATNGTYVFLTDDSGIGDSHLKPTTDEYDVETFNDLIIRLINQYSTTPNCNNLIVYDKSEISDTTIVYENVEKIDDINIKNIDTNKVEIKIDNPQNNNVDTNKVVTENVEVKKQLEKKLVIYPNPTSGELKIEIIGEQKELFLADISGKILRRFETNDDEIFEIYIGDFPSGIYFIQYFNQDKVITGKVILIK